MEFTFEVPESLKIVIVDNGITENHIRCAVQRALGRNLKLGSLEFINDAAEFLSTIRPVVKALIQLKEIPAC